MPNLADTRRVTLLMVQSKEVCLDDVAGEVVSNAELRRRLVRDPVGQAIMFELYIRLFYRFVLGVREDCVAQTTGVKTPDARREWCTDGVAASVVVFGSFSQLLAVRGEVEASGRGSLHPHVEGWPVCELLRDRFDALLKDGAEVKSRMRTLTLRRILLPVLSAQGHAACWGRAQLSNHSRRLLYCRRPCHLSRTAAVSSLASACAASVRTSGRGSQR